MSNRRRLTQPADTVHHSGHAQHDAQPAHEHHESVHDPAHEQAMADHSRASRSAAPAGRVESMRLKRGNSGRNR